MRRQYLVSLTVLLLLVCFIFLTLLNRSQRKIIRTKATEHSQPSQSLIALRQEMRRLSNDISTNYTAYQETQDAQQKQNLSIIIAQIAKKRKGLIKTIFDLNPHVLNKLALPKDLLDDIHANVPSISSYLEKWIGTEGIVETFHVDQFKNKKTYYVYFFTDQTTKQKFRLHLPEDYELISGTTIQIEGIVIPKKQITTESIPYYSPTPSTYLSVNSIMGLAEKEPNEDIVVEVVNLVQGPALPTETQGEQKVLVLLAYPNDIPQNRLLAPSSINSRLVEQVGEFYKKNSYGKFILRPVLIEKWYQLPHPASFYGDFYSGFGQIYQEMFPLLLKDNIDINQYTRLAIIAVTPDADGGVASVGRAPIFSQVFGDFITSNPSYLLVFVPFYSDIQVEDYKTEDGNLSTFDFLFAHELGHNLGSHHSSSMICQNQIVTISLAKTALCEREEYGNVFDVMGGGDKDLKNAQGLHFNSYIKYKFGWIGKDSPAKLLRIDSKNPYGEYTLQRMGNNGTIGLWIPFGLDSNNVSNADYFLEYRRSAQTKGLAVIANFYLLPFFISHQEFLTHTHLYTSRNLDPLLTNPLIFSDLFNGIEIESPVTHPSEDTLTFTIRKPVINATSADMNKDGVINIFDLVFIANRLGQRGKGDVNGDNKIDKTDLELTAFYFQKQFSTPTGKTITTIEEIIEIMLDQDIVTQNNTIASLLFVLNDEDKKLLQDTILEKIQATQDQVLRDKYYDILFVLFFDTKIYPRLVQPISVDNEVIKFNFPLLLRKTWIGKGYDGYAQLDDVKETFTTIAQNKPLPYAREVEFTSKKPIIEVTFHLFDEELHELFTVTYRYTR